MKPVRELAIFGGSPAFGAPVHVAQLNLPDWAKVERIFREIFRRRYYANNGPLVRALDDTFAEHLGVNHAVCVTNGTIGLAMLARALELSGEVVVPAFTFPATVQALSWAGLTPVLCDVSVETHMMTPETVATSVSSDTTGILGVHLWGRACDPDGLQDFSAKRGLTLLFDACHAIGCTYRGQAIGGLGAGEVFSFHATKVLNGAEGGCITTNDAQLADRLRTMRNFHATETFAMVESRLNGKMSEAQAAMALLSLADLPRNIAANMERHQKYSELLRDVPGLSLMQYPGEANNFQYVVVEVEAAACSLHRDVLLRLLTAENVLCRRHFYPGIHRMAPYRDSISARTGTFPGTDRLCGSLLQLPTGQTVAAADIEQICDLLHGIVDHAEEITARLDAQ
ncbi:MAG: aminotransferase class I/II-fold pyridoxal phosphate-dependent enzyme [Planctomycetota bacterium]